MTKNITRVLSDIDCKKCCLHKYRKQIVPGFGNINTDLMFIAQNPGREEDKEGFPLIGRSGKKLESLLKDIGIERKEVFLSNVVKCLTLENRVPFYDEIKSCQSYIIEEIRKIKPKLIVTLGRVPSNWWANGKQYEWFTYYPEKRWFPVWHPSYLCRFPNKIEKWQSEMKRILTELKFIGE